MLETRRRHTNKRLQGLHLWAQVVTLKSGHVYREKHWGPSFTEMADSHVQMETFTWDSGIMVSGKEEDTLFLTGFRPTIMTNQSQFATMANGRRTRHMGESNHLL